MRQVEEIHQDSTHQDTETRINPNLGLLFHGVELGIECLEYLEQHCPKMFRFLHQIQKYHGLEKLERFSIVLNVAKEYPLLQRKDAVQLVVDVTFDQYLSKVLIHQFGIRPYLAVNSTFFLLEMLAPKLQQGLLSLADKLHQSRAISFAPEFYAYNRMSEIILRETAQGLDGGIKIAHTVNHAIDSLKIMTADTFKTLPDHLIQQAQFFENRQTESDSDICLPPEDWLRGNAKLISMSIDAIQGVLQMGAQASEEVAERLEGEALEILSKNAKARYEMSDSEGIWMAGEDDYADDLMVGATLLRSLQSGFEYVLEFFKEPETPKPPVLQVVEPLPIEITSIEKLKTQQIEPLRIEITSKSHKTLGIKAFFSELGEGIGLLLNGQLFKALFMTNYAPPDKVVQQIHEALRLQVKSFSKDELKLPLKPEQITPFLEVPGPKSTCPLENMTIPTHYGFDPFFAITDDQRFFSIQTFRTPNFSTIRMEDLEGAEALPSYIKDVNILANSSGAILSLGVKLCKETFGISLVFAGIAVLVGKLLSQREEQIASRIEKIKTRVDERIQETCDKVNFLIRLYQKYLNASDPTQRQQVLSQINEEVHGKERLLYWIKHKDKHWKKKPDEVSNKAQKLAAEQAYALIGPVFASAKQFVLFVDNCLKQSTAQLLSSLPTKSLVVSTNAEDHWAAQELDILKNTLIKNFQISCGQSDFHTAFSIANALQKTESSNQLFSLLIAFSQFKLGAFEEAYHICKEQLQTSLSPEQRHPVIELQHDILESSIQEKLKSIDKESSHEKHFELISLVKDAITVSDELNLDTISLHTLHMQLDAIIADWPSAKSHAESIFSKSDTWDEKTFQIWLQASQIIGKLTDPFYLQVIELSEIGLKVDPKNVSLLTLKAKAHFELGTFEEAYPICKELLKTSLSPEQRHPILKLQHNILASSIQEKLKNIDKESSHEKHFELISLVKDAITVSDELHLDTISLHTLHMQLDAIIADWPSAKSHAESIFSKSDTWDEKTFQIWLQASQIIGKLTDPFYLQVIELSEIGLKVDPKNVSLLTLKAKAHFNLKQMELAQSYAKEAYELELNHVEALQIWIIATEASSTFTSQEIYKEVFDYLIQSPNLTVFPLLHQAYVILTEGFQEKIEYLQVLNKHPLLEISWERLRLTKLMIERSISILDQLEENSEIAPSIRQYIASLIRQAEQDVQHSDHHYFYKKNQLFQIQIGHLAFDIALDVFDAITDGHSSFLKVYEKTLSECRQILSNGWMLIEQNCALMLKQHANEITRAFRTPYFPYANVPARLSSDDLFFEASRMPYLFARLGSSIVELAYQWVSELQARQEQGVQERWQRRLFQVYQTLHDINQEIVVPALDAFSSIESGYRLYTLFKDEQTPVLTKWTIAPKQIVNLFSQWSILTRLLLDEPDMHQKNPLSTNPYRLFLGLFLRQANRGYFNRYVGTHGETILRTISLFLSESNVLSFLELGSKFLNVISWPMLAWDLVQALKALPDVILERQIYNLNVDIQKRIKLMQPNPTPDGIREIGLRFIDLKYLTNRNMNIYGQLYIHALYQESLFLNGFEEREVAGDGNCLFHAISFYTEQSALELRALAIQFEETETYRNHYSQFFTEDEALDQHLAHLKRGASVDDERTWGGEHELRALEHILERNILVLLPDGSFSKMSEVNFKNRNTPVIVHFNPNTRHYSAYLLMRSMEFERVYINKLRKTQDTLSKKTREITLKQEQNAQICLGLEASRKTRQDKNKALIERAEKITKDPHIAQLRQEYYNHGKKHDRLCEKSSIGHNAKRIGEIQARVGFFKAPPTKQKIRENTFKNNPLMH